MAFINGNIPIVTNGLVYALDFGNSKSYSSGSNRAVSLAYDPTVTIVTGSTKATPTGISEGIPAYLSGILSFTGSQFIQRTSSFSFLTQNNSFTLSYVASSRTEGTLVSQRTSDAVFNIQIAPTQSQVGFYYDNQSYSRLYTFPSSSTLRYFTFRFDSGSFDFFINGVPVTSSNPNAPIQNYEDLNALYIGMQTGEVRGMSASLANLYVYNRALTANEIYSNYSVFAGRFGMPVVPKPYSIDEDLYQYIQTSGIADSNTQTALSTFVSGLKSNGLWNKFIAIYPFLGSTTSSQALNLKETGPYSVSYTGSWTAGSVGSTGTPTSTISLGVAPTTAYTDFRSSSAHLTYLSYDLPQTSSYLVGAVSYMSASGGDIIFSGSRTYHVFTASATFSAFQQGAVEILAVAGGGGTVFRVGGGSGGGGAGGVVYQTTFTLPSGSTIVTVGSGGEAKLGNVGGNGNNGQNTTIGSLTAIGGGGGQGNTVSASAGGSAGGLVGTSITPVLGVPGQGNSGGLGANVGDAGGGGGAGQFGKNARAGGQGGSGSFFPQFLFLNYGVPVGWFGGGGGGGSGGGSGGINVLPPGGPGGGGRGGYTSTRGISGSANTGGGGGGIWDHQQTGSAGGSGIVIISYPTAPTSSFALKITETSLTGSLNSPETSAITASGNIGLVTVSRKQAGIVSLHKNTISASFGTSGSFLPFPNLYLNAANNAGTASGITPSTVAYASVGAGLTTTEVATYHNLISQLQTNLKRQNTLLDTYTGAAAAYSLRRIGPSGYFGPAIKVRRDSDNTLRDIGFTSDGQLDTVALLDFVGVTGSGFVNTWYDQSGNGYDIGQANTTYQPYVILSGSIPLQNKKPFLYFDGVNYRLEASGNSLNAVNFIAATGSIFTVSKLRSDSTNVALWWMVFDSNLGSFSILSPTSTQRRGPGYVELTRTGGNLFNSTSLTISSNIFQTNNTLRFVDNTQYSGSGGSFSYSAGKTFWIGGTFGAGSFLQRAEMNLSELILHNVDQSSNRTAIESNINDNYKIYGSTTASFDTDYQSFITATGITQPTQSAALETLVSDLKSYGLWNKMKAIYPMITDKYNLYSNTENLSTGWLTSNSTVTASNVAGPFTSSLVANRLNEVSGSSISPTIYQTVTLTSGSSYVMSVYARWNNRDYLVLNPDGNSKTWFDIRNGFVSSSQGTVATASITRVSGTSANTSGSWYRCAMVFTSSVSTPYNTSIQVANTDGSLTYDSLTGLSGSFLWGAQFEPGTFISPYVANTTNNAYTTSSIFDQFKFNLKDPRDSDSAFRITFSGSWTPAYSGLKGDGAVGTYAATKVNSTVRDLAINSGSFSVYSRSNTVGSFGMYGNQNVTNTRFNWDGSNFKAEYGGPYLAVGTTDSYPDNIRGLLTVNRNLNRTTGFVRTQKYIDYTYGNADGTVVLNDIAVGFGGFMFGIYYNGTSFSANGGGIARNAWEQAFATFAGVPLSDYESKALYWIVQKYQTTLGRQVY